MVLLYLCYTPFVVVVVLFSFLMFSLLINGVVVVWMGYISSVVRRCLSITRTGLELGGGRPGDLSDLVLFALNARSINSNCMNFQQSLGMNHLHPVHGWHLYEMLQRDSGMVGAAIQTDMSSSSSTSDFHSVSRFPRSGEP